MLVTRQRARCLLFPLLLLAVGGCASSGAPKGWLPVPGESGPDPYGGWITIEYGEPPNTLAGEFLCVDFDSLYVLVDHAGADAEVDCIPTADVVEARIAYFDAQVGQAAAAVAGGALASVSHGFYVLISAPVWLVIGGSMAGVHSYAPLADYPDHDWEVLRRFARFPQGVPVGLRGLGLRGREVEPPMEKPVRNPPEF